MNKAPTIEEAKTALEQQKCFSNNQQKYPSIRIIGAGGCGINIVKRFLKSNFTFDENVTYRIIDTAKSNLSGLPSDIPFDAISELGSGKDRSKNADIIQKYCDMHESLFKDDTDITIICFSMAGGSGSVIAPLLTHRILRNSKHAVVLVGVVDNSSARDCNNTINTLRSFSNIAEKHKYYLPLMLFSNIGIGRIPTNVTIVRRLAEFVKLMTSRSIEELDYSDKMNFLRPTAVMNCPAGVYLLAVSATTPETSENLHGELVFNLDQGDSIHACIVVNDTGMIPNILTNVNYVGITEDESERYFCTIGHQVPKDLIDKLNETRERYDETSVQTDNISTSLQMNGAENNQGIIV